MIILHIANINDKKSKGPNINVPKNIIYGNKFANVGLYNLVDSKLAIEIPSEKNFNINQFKSIDELPSPFNKPDIVIFQGVYYIKHCLIARDLKKKGIPYVIVPRSSLTTAAIQNKYLKKKIANLLFFNNFIQNAKKIQFLTKNEYLESKDNFKINDYFILGNGFEIPNKAYSIKKRKEFKITFIARYNIYHKGLDVLLDSVMDNKKWFIDNNITINLYGTDSEGGLKFLEELINKQKLEKIVKLNGPVFDIQKENVLLDSDLFIHTSRLEGQPTSIIEAISYGIPVIVTPGTNIADVVKENNLGFTTNLDSNDIFLCIKKAYDEFENFKNISCNERKYAKENFN